MEAGSSSLRSTTASIVRAARSSGRTAESTPAYRPTGVRRASRITASGMGRERTLASRGRVFLVRLLRGAGGDRDLPGDREVVSRLRGGAGGLAPHALARGGGRTGDRRRGPDDRGPECPPPGERPPGDHRGRRARSGGRGRALAPGAAQAGARREPTADVKPASGGEPAPRGEPAPDGRLTWRACSSSAAAAAAGRSGPPSAAWGRPRGGTG